MGKVNKLQETGFASPRRTGQKPEVARREPEVEISQDFGFAIISEADIVKFDDHERIGPSVLRSCVTRQTGLSATFHLSHDSGYL